MIRRRPWFERSFVTGLPAEMLPVVIERLRGTPPRMQDRVSRLDPAILTSGNGDHWSIQENVGHLSDVEPLWWRRFQDFAAGHSELSPADLSNRATTEARHNETPIAELLSLFRKRRTELVMHLESLTDSKAVVTALHPRLKTPMNQVDLAQFIAEHDDYHLCKISELIRQFG